MATNNNKQATLSPREMEVLAIAWQCMEQQPKVPKSQCTTKSRPPEIKSSQTDIALT